MSQLMIMAGGTGGHVFPALAVANLLRDRGVDVVWLGTRNGLEARVVPAAEFPIEWINVKGLRGKGLLGWLVSPLLILRASFEAWRIIRRRRPDALLGMGGFVSGPGGLVAWLMRLPLMIHEQNAIAGLTNRGLSRLASRVFTGFPDVLPRAEHVGNPLRKGFVDIASKDHSEVDRAGSNAQLNLLIVGGSLGAKALNEVMPVAISELDAATRPAIRHQCGRGSVSTVEQHYRELSIDAEVDEFIDDMPKAYAWADIVLCRAGAMTIAEVAAAGVAAVFVPFPHAVGDHQTANARYLSDHNAAVLIDQNDLTASSLSVELNNLISIPGRLEEIGHRAAAFARVDATEVIADACQEVLNA